MAIDDTFDWGATATALGLSHAPDRPSDSVIGNGYPDGFPIPADQFNWLAYIAGITHHRTHGYTYLEDAYDAIGDGELALVLDDDRLNASGGPTILGEPGTPYSTHNIARAGMVSVGASGRSYVECSSASTDIKVWDRASDSGSGHTLLATCTQSNAGAAARVISDGNVVVAIYGTWVECWEHDTGASRWTYNHTATLDDVCMDGVRVYVVGDSNAASENIAAIPIDDSGAATPDWTYDHAGRLYSCACDGRRLFVAGIASGAASGAIARSIQADDGTDLANEGGNGVSLRLDVWDLVLAQPVTGSHRVVTDGVRVAFAIDAGAAHSLDVRDCVTGTQWGTYVYAGSDIACLAIDQDYIFCGTNDGGAPNVGFASCLEKTTLIESWRSSESGAAVLSNVFAIDSDGASVVYCRDAAANPYSKRLVRGNRGTMFKKIVDAESTYRLTAKCMEPQLS